eukprot:CAMPEP_0196780962 /NCGR_PEP_ID=MMETSP1104-20130614/8928_1 /TAXON_ID=33652 /ORGANISM="Cafeteria sp., Strain Caron Lab Isolate" /LENGTH=224 /DNA_ID=CAMNT_0042151179 /DNA_START=29 /DNA_END=703 /DNA_ORIENTATION=+
MSNIRFLAVARAQDSTILASGCSTSDAGGGFLKTVQQILSAPGFSQKAKPRQRIRLVSQTHHVSFTSDSVQRVYFAITDKSYSERLTFTLIEELQSKFVETTGDRYRTASENSMNRACAGLFRDLFRKYENPSNVDTLSRLQGRLDAVTETMQDNVRQMLANVDKAEVLEDDAARLATVAGRMEADAHKLERKMRCRKIKMYLLITFIVLAIIGVIVAIIASQA